MLHTQTMPPLFQEISIDAMAPGWLEKFTRLWYACPADLPDLGRIYTPQEQARREKQASRLLDGLVHELKHLPAAKEGRQAAQARIQAAGAAFAQANLGIEAAHFKLVEKYHFAEIAREFSQKAREFDAAITPADIYQASRNVLTMNFIQLLLGLPVELTPSIFAYSMLYPYTDNYLDDPSIDLKAKFLFNERLRRRLLGEHQTPINACEQAIYRLINMIEDQFERPRYPQVYQSLLAIHLAQTKSLRLHQMASPYQTDVLGLSFEKGGMAVVADGCLVAGSLLPMQAEFMYGYGVFTQLMDDLEDLAQDRQDGILTIFTQAARAWKLDAITNQMLHLGTRVFELMDAFGSPESLEFKALILKCIQPLIMDAASQSPASYNWAYLKTLECHLPFRYAFLASQRRRFKRQKITVTKLIEALI